MNAIAAKLGRLTGWRRLLVAALLGCLAAFAMPPADLWAAFIVAMTAMVWLLDGASAGGVSRGRALRRAFGVGWAFGFGYFLVGLVWVAEAFLVDADQFAWMIPFAVTALPAGLAVFWGAGTALAMLSWRPGPGRIFALAAALAATEWLRGHIFTGFPWNAPGYAVAGLAPLSQLAALVGVYGLSLFVVLVAATPALLADRPARAVPRISVVVAAMLLVAAGWAFGDRRLAGARDGDAGAPMLRIVQPSIPQRDKWKPELRAEIFARYLALSNKPTAQAPGGLRDIDVLIWPESAIPFLLEERPDALRAVASLLPDGTVLITGAIRREATGTAVDARSRLYNSVLVLDDAASVRGRYDKWHLVPFGEYLPFERWLEPLGFRQLVTVPLSFSFGEGPETLEVDGLPPVGPLICYEAIFPGRVADPGRRPGWLLNVTNDAWFGTSMGPYQHFAQARFRAIEEGLALVRAANTGISGIVDPYGRVERRLGLNQTGVIDGPLPRALEPTVYSRIGDWGLLALVIAAWALARGLPAPNGREPPTPSRVG